MKTITLYESMFKPDEWEDLLKEMKFTGEDLGMVQEVDLKLDSANIPDYAVNSEFDNIDKLNIEY